MAVPFPLSSSERRIEALSFSVGDVAPYERRESPARSAKYLIARIRYGPPAEPAPDSGYSGSSGNKPLDAGILKLAPDA